MRIPRDYAGRVWCTPDMWLNIATEEAHLSGINPVPLLAGRRDIKNSRARWRAFKRLRLMGCSYTSIAQASGFDHTSVMHAVKSQRDAFPSYYTRAKEVKAELPADPLGSRLAQVLGRVA